MSLIDAYKSGMNETLSTPFDEVRNASVMLLNNIKSNSKYFTVIKKSYNALNPNNSSSLSQSEMVDELLNAIKSVSFGNETVESVLEQISADEFKRIADSSQKGGKTKRNRRRANRTKSQRRINNYVGGEHVDNFFRVAWTILLLISLIMGPDKFFGELPVFVADNMPVKTLLFLMFIAFNILLIKHPTRFE